MKWLHRWADATLRRENVRLRAELVAVREHRRTAIGVGSAAVRRRREAEREVAALAHRNAELVKVYNALTVDWVDINDQYVAAVNDLASAYRRIDQLALEVFALGGDVTCRRTS